MKTTTVAIAALAGVATADTWSAWDPKATTTTATTSTWGEWDPTTTDDCTTTTVDDWAQSEGVSTDCDTSTTTWEQGSTTTWAAAASASSTWVWPEQDDPSACSMTVLTSTGAPVWDPQPDWTSYSTLYVTPVEATSTSSSAETWLEWTSTSSSSTTTPSASWPAWPTDGASSASASWGWSISSAVWSAPSASWSPSPINSWSSASASWGWSASSAVWSAPSASWSPSPVKSWSSASASWSASSTNSWSTPSASPSSGSGHSPISPNGNSWAMTWSPYPASGTGCKDQGTVETEIALIASKGFSSVRVYSTDCKTLELVGNACRQHGMKMILGVFISGSGISGAQQQVSDIVAWAQWDIVELIVVGNEAVFNNYCSASDLAVFISNVKGQCSGAGYTGPLSTTEPLSIWQSAGSALLGSVDVVSANLYAFFNSATTADQAGSFIQSEIGILEGLSGGKNVYVMETGWPSSGSCNGAACPGTSEQATAVKSIQSISGAQVVFFSFEDDAWKEPGQYNVEQHWGCVNAF